MKTILLADDDPSIKKMIARRLASDKYRVIMAKDGEEALALAKAEHPDLIILDIMMPKKDGNIVAAELREQKETNRIPIIFLTCLMRPQESEKVHHMVGQNTMLAKPFNGADLLKLVEERLAA